MRPFLVLLLAVAGCLSTPKDDAPSPDDGVGPYVVISEPCPPDAIDVSGLVVAEVLVCCGGICAPAEGWYIVSDEALLFVDCPDGCDAAVQTIQQE